MKKFILMVCLAIFATLAQAAEHKASGTVDAVNTGDRSVKISHGPIRSMGMGAMTMVFKVADPSMIMDMKKGQKINFVFETNSSGEFVIVDFE